MIALLRKRPAFARLWLAGAISLVGDWLSFVAVSILAVRSGGGAFALALVMAAHSLPGALATPIAGALADRFDRRALLVGANVVNALLTAAMAGCAWIGAIGAVPALLLVRGVVAAFVVPAEAAAMRGLVGEGELLGANAILAGTWSTAYVVGMALGGALAALGPVLAIALDAATFLAAALLVTALPRLVPPAGAEALRPLQALRAVPRDLAAAWRFAVARPTLLRAVLAKTPVALASGCGWLALNLIADSLHPFGAAALSLGVLQAARGAGTGIGPAIAIRLRRGDGTRLLTASTLLAFAGMFAVAFATRAPLLAAITFAWGLGTGSNWVLSSATVQRLAGDDAVGRLVALDELMLTVSMVGSTFAGAAVVAHGGTKLVVALGAALGLTGLALAELASRRRPGAETEAHENRTHRVEP